MNAQWNYKKNDMSKVMANQHFGPLTIVVGEFKITLPKSALTKDGMIKKNVRSLIERGRFDSLKRQGAKIQAAETA